MYKKILAAMAAMVLVVGAGAAAGSGIVSDSFSISASAATYNDYEYEVLSDGTVKITEYKGESGDIEIPSEIDGKKVTVIGEESFSPYSTNFDVRGEVSLVIPEGVTTIESGAFRMIDFKKLVLPESLVTIGDFAFQECLIPDKLVIPSNVKTIGNSAFHYTYGYDTLEMGDSVETIGPSAFSCYGLYSENGETLKNVKLSKNLKEIGDYAFSKSNIERLDVSYGVTKIGKCAFGNIGTLTIPSTVTEMDGAFDDASCGVKNLYLYGGYKKIDRDCSLCYSALQLSLENLYIGEGVEEIDQYAFVDFKKLKYVAVPQSVKTIGERALGFNIQFARSAFDYDYYYTDGFKLGVFEGSAGEEYAKTFGIDYEYLTEPLTDVPEKEENGNGDTPSNGDQDEDNSANGGSSANDNGNDNGNANNNNNDSVPDTGAKTAAAAVLTITAAAVTAGVKRRK